MSGIYEPLFISLTASVVWAPFLYYFAENFTKNRPESHSDKLWLLFLILAVLPVILTPFTTATGLSLRAPNTAPLAEPVMLNDVSSYELAADTTPFKSKESTAYEIPLIKLSVLIYAYVVLCLFFAKVFAYFVFKLRLRIAVEVDDAALLYAADSWRQRIGLRILPKILNTNATSSVCVHGIVRPVILLPYYINNHASSNEASLMIAHELAHIKRRDTVLFSFIALLKLLFWFNPYIYRLSALVLLTAEQASDRLVITHGAKPKDYAQCFLKALRIAAKNKMDNFIYTPSFTPFDKRSRRIRLNAMLHHASNTKIISIKSRVKLSIIISIAAAVAFAQAAMAVAPSPINQFLPVQPVVGAITLGFRAQSSALDGNRQFHEGIDIKAPLGTIVRAAGKGKVIATTNRYNDNLDWGNVVVIDHGHGVLTKYAHLNGFFIEKGATVEAGDPIASVGLSGKATRPHLHFEIISDGIHVDPATLFAPSKQAPNIIPTTKLQPVESVNNNADKELTTSAQNMQPTAVPAALNEIIEHAMEKSVGGEHIVLQNARLERALAQAERTKARALRNNARALRDAKRAQANREKHIAITMTNAEKTLSRVKKNASRDERRQQFKLSKVEQKFLQKKSSADQTYSIGLIESNVDHFEAQIREDVLRKKEEAILKAHQRVLETQRNLEMQLEEIRKERQQISSSKQND